MKPILMDTENVRALLEGRKTVTRRVVKHQPSSNYELVRGMYRDGNGRLCAVFHSSEDIKSVYPNYDRGDILWVRETWAKNPFGDGYIYPTEVPGAGQKWKPSIHMPREAARIFLLVTDVRVEHLQEITTSQARAEGQPKCPGSIAICGKFHGCQHCEAEISNAVLWFESVWNKTIPKHPNKFKRYPYYYEDDPWVWVINFERISKEEAEG